MGVVWVDEVCVCVDNGLSVVKVEDGTEVCRSEAVKMDGIDTDILSNDTG